MKKKKLGVISGMGTRAGLLFLQKLTDRIEAPTDQDFPEFFVHNNSTIPDRTKAIVYNGKSPVNELIRSLKIMEKCNVDLIVVTCITSYFFINQLQDPIKYKILNPIQLLLENLRYEYNHVNKVGLLATTGTITSGLFHQAMANTSFDLITPNDYIQEEKLMKSIYMKGGLKSAQIDNKAYALFQEAVDDLKQQKAELIIGGCTEVQIGLDKIEEDILFIDVIDLLINEVIQKMNLKKKTKIEESIIYE